MEKIQTAKDGRVRMKVISREDIEFKQMTAQGAGVAHSHLQ